MKAIENHNKDYAEGKHSWYMRINYFADMTHEEFVKRIQVKVPELAKLHYTYKMEATSVVEEIDWRTKVSIVAVIYS